MVIEVHSLVPARLLLLLAAMALVLVQAAMVCPPANAAARLTMNDPAHHACEDKAPGDREKQQRAGRDCAVACTAPMPAAALLPFAWAAPPAASPPAMIRQLHGKDLEPSDPPPRHA